MSAVTLPSNIRSAGLPLKVKVEGGARVRFKEDRGRTVLDELYQHDPVRILFPHNPPGELTIGVLTTTSGGLVGGDKIEVSVVAGASTRSMVMAQAAEKIYRSTGEDCLIDITVEAHDDTWFEWLPQETILHEGARMRRTTRLDLKSQARVLAGEFLVFGRQAMGEKMTTGLVRDCWDVRMDGRPVWADAFHLEGEVDQIINHPAGLGGASAIANAVYAGPDAESYLDLARDLLTETEHVRCAASFVNQVLLVRWIGRDVFSLRNSFADFWKKFRHHVGGQPEILPRLWDI